jgi:hypothetical protein
MSILIGTCTSRGSRGSSRYFQVKAMARLISAVRLAVGLWIGMFVSSRRLEA